MKTRAVLKSQKAVTEKQLAMLKTFLKEQYHKDIEIDWEYDKTVKNGFILTYKADIYDWSLQGRVEQFLKKIKKLPLNNEKYIDLVKTEIKDFQPQINSYEVGKVVRTGDGIAMIKGLLHCRYDEIVLFENGSKGIVLDIKPDLLSAIILNDESSIEEGSAVYRSERTAAIPVGEDFLGRVVNSLGEPIDALGPIIAEKLKSMEKAAPSILDRRPVYRPLETGILAIDSMFPIGRGQRELIIGDRQTGKTAIALDTILNQKGKDVICVYVAIGQKSHQVATMVNQLKKKDALQYTIVVFAGAGDSSAMQYIAPYAGTTLAEYFMEKGKDVLIVYDDLSKHAVAYRSISLLLERFPGREAYPGDVFYLHSRLLERSAQLSDENGGGSMTALPIVETQKGDISAYVPTNIISITDGQIFLESDLFFAGQKPAINVGLSVSRVGGAAQTKAMQTAAKSLRFVLAQYREMKVFTQFANDLDETTKKQLVYGRNLMELLKQKQNQPYDLIDQIIILLIGLSDLLLQTPQEQIAQVMSYMIRYIKEHAADTVHNIIAGKKLSEENKKILLHYAEEFMQMKED